MSIFKESFRKFVKQQIAIREAILSQGNKGILQQEFLDPDDPVAIYSERDGMKFPLTSEYNEKIGKLNKPKILNAARNKKQKVDLRSHGGDFLDIDANAFYTYQQKTCTIRMASGTDLTFDGAKSLATNSSLSDGRSLYGASQLKGSGLARRYVLQGGTLAIDRTASGTEEVTTETQAARVDKVFGKVWEKGYTKQTRSRKENYNYKLGKRTGFTGASKNRFGTAYGDPTIASEAGNMGYGALPMPGITKVDIRSKSAYGSLREAKIDFVCHSQKQLEALELLYMRPGIPILLEWGWTNYINNKGKITTKEFPFEKTLGNFFIREFNLALIYQGIIEEKRDSGGNYDGMVGMCKNFNYKARPDGGYDCTTEIVSMGEVLESIKGEALNIGKRTTDTMELCLDLCIQFSQAVADTTTKKGANRSWLSNNLYFFWTALVSPRKLAEQYQLSLADSVFTAFMPLISSFTNSKRAVNIASGETLFDLFNLNEKGKVKIKSTTESDEEDIQEKEVYINCYEPDNVDLDGSPEARLKQLKRFILTEEQYIGGNKNNFEVKQPYIRWDALTRLINKFVIKKDGTGKPMCQLETHQIIEGKDNGYTVEPLLYTRLPFFTVPFVDDSGIIRYTDIYEDDTKWFNFGLDYNGTINVNDLIDMSVDPSICLTPAQVLESAQRPELLFDKVVSLYQGKSLLGQALITSAAVTAAVTPVGLTLGIRDILKSKQKILTAQSSGPDVDQDWKRVIGHIYINLQRLLFLFEKERYDDEGNQIKDFNMFDFLQKVWDDISTAMGNHHDFQLHVDYERPNIVRVVDLKYQMENNLNRYNIHQLKIQSNDTICREFNYNSVIPNELSTTIAVGVQNPDNIDDLDQASFAALNKGLRSRFHVPKSSETEEDKVPTEKEREAKRTQYDALVISIRDNVDALFEHRVKCLKGDYQGINSEGNPNDKKKIGRMSATLSSLFKDINKELTLYKYDEADGLYYKGYPKKIETTPPISSVIPLKFTAKLDGIGGIVIGNVFGVDETRLPVAYQDANVAFVVTKEGHTLNGNDWTTDIEGQMVLLPSVEKEPEGKRVDPKTLLFQTIKEEGIKPAENPQSTTAQGEQTQEQKELDPEMEKVKVGDKVYLKIGQQETVGTKVRSGPKVDNESTFDFGEDNIIGMFNPRCKGILLGEVLEITFQNRDFKGTFDWNETDQIYMFNGQAVTELPDDAIPWYLIQFNYEHPSMYSNFHLGAGPNWDGVVGNNEANMWPYWFNLNNPENSGKPWVPGAAGYSYSNSDATWHAEKFRRGEPPFLQKSYQFPGVKSSIEGGIFDFYDSIQYSEDPRLEKYPTPGNVNGQGWMRIDVLQANSAYGFSRAENIERIALAELASSNAAIPATQISGDWNGSPRIGKDQRIQRKDIDAQKAKATQTWQGYLDAGFRPDYAAGIIQSYGYLNVPAASTFSRDEAFVDRDGSVDSSDTVDGVSGATNTSNNNLGLGNQGPVDPNALQSE